MTMCKICNVNPMSNGAYVATGREICFDCSYRLVDKCKLAILRKSLYKFKRCMLCQGTIDRILMDILDMTICGKCQGFATKICDEIYERMLLVVKDA